MDEIVKRVFGEYKLKGSGWSAKKTIVAYATDGVG